MVNDSGGERNVVGLSEFPRLFIYRDTAKAPYPPNGHWHIDSSQFVTGSWEIIPS